MQKTEEQIGSGKANKAKYTIDDFQLGKIVGEGAYGQVRLATIKATGDTVAVKAVNREQILKLGKQRHIYRERDLLNEMDHPFIIKLIATTLVSRLERSHRAGRHQLVLRV